MKKSHAQVTSVDNVDFPPNLDRFKILPTADQEARSCGRWFRYADFQPTGYFMAAGGEAQFSLSLPETVNVTAELLVGTPGFGKSGSETETPRRYPLTPGCNRIGDNEGGVLWLRVVSEDAMATTLEAILSFTTLHNVSRLPVFLQGYTEPARWRSILLAAELTSERSPVQYISQEVVITAWYSTALEFAYHNPSQTLDEYRNILRIENAIGSIGTEPGQYPPSSLRILVSEKEAGNPNASNFRISLPQYGSALVTAKGVREDWGVWHELGHMQHQIAWSANALTENSVNIFSLAVQRALKKYSRAVPYNDEAHAFLNDDSPQKKFEDADVFVRLIMWEQLRIAYGEAFFHRLHQESRVNGNSDTGQGDAQYRHYFMVTATQAARQDLTAFFIRWGWHPEARTLEAIRDLKLPFPHPDPSTLDVEAETQIQSAFRFEAEIFILGAARPGSRLKTSNDPDIGWYDPERGAMYTPSSGLFVLSTSRCVDGMAVVKSYDPVTDEPLGESNHAPIVTCVRPMAVEHVTNCIIDNHEGDH